VYLVGQTRVHIDEVENLGWFVELEVVLEPDQSTQEGLAIAHELINRLGINHQDFVDCSYVDLLNVKERVEVSSYANPARS
ncbi:MAG: hypothetical protein MN733_44090, partial [Nitrososphaera sp.]|nr:hypothetical protein [Nitrososphaera sp.]